MSTKNKTNNLKLPQYTEEDLFDMKEVNEAYKIIDESYKEQNDNYKQAIETSTIKGAIDNLELIDARKGKRTLGEKISEIDSQLENIENKKVDKTTLISVLDFGVVADALYKDEITGIWYSDVNKTILATDNTNAFKLAFNSSYQNIIIPNGNYLVNNEVILSTSNKNITCFGTIVCEGKDTKAQYEMNVFCLNNVSNINICGFKMYTDRFIDTSSHWGDRPRTIQKSSQRIAFNLCGTYNINFYDMSFSGFEYDFKIDTAHNVTNTNLLEVNKNIKINGVISKECSQPLLINHSSYIYIKNYNVIVANGLSSMEHFIYFNGYDKHIYIDNCTLINNDGRLGSCFNLRVDGSTSGETYNDSDVHDIHCNDCSFYGIRCIATATNTNDFYLSNPRIIGFATGDYTTSLFHVTNAGKIIVNGGYIECGNQLISDGGVNTYIRFNGSEIKTKHRLTTSSTSTYNKNIVFSNCDITIETDLDTISTGWLYISGTQGGQILFNSCNFYFPVAPKFSQVISVRSATMDVIFNNCLIKCDGEKIANFTYSAKNSNLKQRFLNCYFIGVTRIASESELALMRVINTIVEE